MKRIKRLSFILFCLYILCGCSNSIFYKSKENAREETAIVKFSIKDTFNQTARYIGPDISGHTKQQLTNLKLSIDDEYEYSWDTYEEFEAAEGIIIPIGNHKIILSGYIDSVHYSSSGVGFYGWYEKQFVHFINPGTNYISLELRLDGIKDGEKGEHGILDITVYFPAMEGNLEAKVYLDNKHEKAWDPYVDMNNLISAKQPYGIVTEFQTCSDPSSRYYNKMYFSYQGITEADDNTDIKIIVEDKDCKHNIAAYYFDVAEFSENCTTKKTIEIPELINVYHVYYYDGAIINEEPHIYLVETIPLGGDDYTVIDINWFEDEDCTKGAIYDPNGNFPTPQTYRNVNSDLKFYRKSWQDKELITLNFVTNCDKTLLPIQVPKGSIRFNSEKLYFDSSNINCYVYNMNNWAWGFNGWYFDEAFTTSSVNATDDVTVYAKWSENTPIEISFETNCDIKYRPRLISKGIEIKLEKDVLILSFPEYSRESLPDYKGFNPIPIEKSGYTFAGWYFDENFTQSACDDYVLPPQNNNKLTLYAKWIPN